MEGLIGKIEKRIADSERNLGLDWRFSYSNVVVIGEKRVRVEVTSAEIYEALKSVHPIEMHVTSDTGTRVSLETTEGTAIEIVLLRPPEGHRLWVVSSVADMRRSPDHASELVNQGIMGEVFEGLKKQDDWHLCRTKEGYLGWVRSWYLEEAESSAIDSYDSRRNRMVKASIAYIYSSPSSSSLPVSDAVAGTCIVSVGRLGDFEEVLLPVSRRGFVKGEDIETYKKQRKPDRSRLIERARRFIGIQYLWGGTSSKGFDCSGFVKRVFGMEGVELPRDSDMQAQVGTLVPLEDIGRAAKGDLLFFGEKGSVTHVALYTGGGRFIHSYGEVKMGSLDEDDPEYDEKLARSLLFARKIL